MVSKQYGKSLSSYIRKISFFLGLVLFSNLSSVFGEQLVYKNDEFASDIQEAVNQISGKSLVVQPGFAQGEAFGQIFTPGKGDYPVKILGMDLILAEPLNAKGLSCNADIEIWVNDSGELLPDKKQPDFKISTSELFNPMTGQDGMPLQGGSAMQLDFDWNDPSGHPPLVTSKKIRVMVRFTEPGLDMQKEWGTFQCALWPEMGACGCQKVGILLDFGITLKTNLVNLVWPLGKCSGDKEWKYFEDISMKGDVVMRLRVETSQSCTPDCKQKQCGDDGCGGSCGACPDGCTCVNHTCQGECKKADCGDKECGDDGVGGSCGTCPQGKKCIDFRCVCIPSCSDKECGNDGCGGSCGECDNDKECNEGKCIETHANTVLKVTAISPSWGYTDEQTFISVIGGGFEKGLIALLGGTPLMSIDVKNSTLFWGTVPKGMNPGIYMLVVVNPSGESAFLQDAFEVRERMKESLSGGNPKNSSGCSVNQGIFSYLSIILLLFCLTLLVSKKRHE